MRLASAAGACKLEAMASALPYLRLPFPVELSELLFAAALEMSKHTGKAFRIATHGRRSGRTLRPGLQTPLWNELRSQLRPYLTEYGQQVNLGRLLGLPRQRIHGFITRGDQMPDAERTLQLLAWLMAVHQGGRPA